MSEKETSPATRTKLSFVNIYFIISLFIAFAFFFKSSLGGIVEFIFTFFFAITVVLPLSKYTERLHVSPSTSLLLAYAVVCLLIASAIFIIEPFYFPQLNKTAEIFFVLPDFGLLSIIKHLFFTIFDPSDLIASDFTFVLSLMLPLAVSYVFLKNRCTVKCLLIKLFSSYRPSAFFQKILPALFKAYIAFYNFLFFRLAGGLFIAATAFIGFSVLRLPNALALAIIAGTLSVLPYWGGIISIALIILYAGSFHFMYAIGACAVAIAAFLLKIRLFRLSKLPNAAVSPLAVGITALFTLKITGAAGILLAAPVFIFIKYFLNALFDNINPRKDTLQTVNRCQ